MTRPTTPLFAASLIAALALVACGPSAAPIEDLYGEAQDDLSATRGRFETFVGRDGRFYFHLVAGNGEKVLASQGYTTLSGAQNGIASVKTNGVNAERFQLRQTVDGDWYFVVRAGNYKVIGHSEIYASKANAERAAGTVRQVIQNTVERGAAQTGSTRFQIFRGLDGQYYFHLRADNGEIILQSEGYTSRAGATNGTVSVENNGVNAARYVIKEAADGQHYFVLRAGNHQVIAQGETYETRAGAEAGVATSIKLLSGDIR